MQIWLQPSVFSWHSSISYSGWREMKIRNSNSSVEIYHHIRDCRLIRQNQGYRSRNSFQGYWYSPEHSHQFLRHIHQFLHIKNTHACIKGVYMSLYYCTIAGMSVYFKPVSTIAITWVGANSVWAYLSTTISIFTTFINIYSQYNNQSVCIYDSL